MTNGAKCFDVTLKREQYEGKGIHVSTEDVIGFFENQNDIESWCFEPEGGDDFVPYPHMQIRYVCKTKRELKKEIERWQDYFWSVNGPHVSITGLKHINWEYVQKEGNYTASWEYKSPLMRFKKLELRDWQFDTCKKLMAQDERSVMCIVDVDGNHGKTYLRKFLQANKLCHYIPEMNDMRDLMRISMNKYENEKIDGFCFDLPRADGDKKNIALWKAIEEIKNGYLYDDRYHFREMWIDVPKILVFTNDYPEQSVLSKDRWKIYTIMDGIEGTYLQPYTGA